MRKTRDTSTNIMTPANVRAERSVLGAILEMDSLFRDAIAIGLRSEDFSLRDHGRIYAAMICLGDASQPIDHICLIEKLGNSAEGIALLGDLVVGVVLERRRHTLFPANPNTIVDVELPSQRHPRAEENVHRQSKMGPGAS